MKSNRTNNFYKRKMKPYSVCRYKEIWGYSNYNSRQLQHNADKANKKRYRQQLKHETIILIEEWLDYNSLTIKFDF